MNPPEDKIADALLRRQAIQSGRLNFKRVDACPEDTLNRILWHAVKGSAVPYPAWAVTLAPDDRQGAKFSKRPIEVPRSSSERHF